ncbi:MAG: sce7726 family protein [Candidatus Margulisiibacteriota bacterium]
MTNEKYNYCLGHLFSPKILNDYASLAENDFFSNTINESKFMSRFDGPITYLKLFDELYAYLKSNYRNEYVYKNAIADKILLGRHSVNTSTLLTEFRVGSSKADVIVINGTSTVYEIKTEFDKLDRLQNQINAYLKVFDKIFVVTHVSKVAQVLALVPPQIGVIELTDCYTLRVIRSAESNIENVSPASIFDVLRKGEYCQIIEEEFSCVPDVPNTRIYKAAKEMFVKLSPERAHEKMVLMLQKRKMDKDFILKMPKSLKHAGFTMNVKRTEQDQFFSFLDKRVGV